MKKIAVILSALSLGACGILPSMPFMGGSDKPEETYVDLRPQPPLQVPEDMRAIDLEQVVPDLDTSNLQNASFYPDRPPLPDALYSADNRDEVRMQRLGERNWLVIPEPPTTAWPKMKQFFADNGVILVDDRPGIGRLNTAWLETSDRPARDVVRTLLNTAREEAGLSTGKDRFLIRVEQGLQPASTEVHLRHDNDTLGNDLSADLVRVQEANSDLLAAEKALLQQIGAFVAARVSESTVSKVALQIGSQPKTELLRNDNGIPELSFYLDKARAVASVTQSLNNAGILIDDQDSDAGRFDITVPREVLTGGKGGILCRITFSCGSRSEREYTLLISEPVATDKGQAIKVYVLQNGQLLADPDRAQELLVVIREFAT
jgi:outer membrane protein assembly factor BamC